MNPLVVLGVTGSIGHQALDVADRLSVEVGAMASGSGGPAFVEAADRHPGAVLAVANPVDRSGLAARFGSRITFGSDAVSALAAVPGHTILNAIVGFAGLDATLVALEAGNRLALANKESLVAAGPLVMAAARASGAELLPVDSEHSALFQCLQGEPPEAVRRVVLTASGGPFRGWDSHRLASVTPAEALAHPTWDMGARISIDSATLVNKGLEVIEAHHLFGVALTCIEVVVHPGSIVHGLVEFVDGSWKAHLGEPDMRVPIALAITHPERAPLLDPFDLVGRSLVFEAPDRTTFPALDLAYRAAEVGGGAPAALNAADEVAVAAFLDGRLPFLGIAEVIASVLERIGSPGIDDVAAVRAVDAEARRLAAAEVGRLGYSASMRPSG